MSDLPGSLRSLLFAPGNRPDRLAKFPESNPSAGVIDLEDAVPPDGKEEARAIARAVAAEIGGLIPLLVRVNAPDSPFFADDVAHALSADLAGVVVPKLDSPADVEVAATALDAAGHGDLPIVAGIETVAGVVGAAMVASHPRVACCYFGAEDYVADLGGVRRPDNLEVQVPRTQVAQAARLGGIPAIDMVVTDFRDDERFLSESAEARALGFAGKLCIHPAQVALATTAFQPPDEELAWARLVVDAYIAARERGEAAIAVDGEMVDEPVARRARALLAAAD